VHWLQPRGAHHGLLARGRVGAAPAT
jgi:hypothetical protein